LVGPDSWFKFKALFLEHIWLYQPVTEWCTSKSYQEIKFFVNSVKVINDTAERGIKRNSDYTVLLTDDPVQRTSLLQAVEDHRHKFHDFFKAALAKSLSNFQMQILRCLTSSKCFVYILFPCFT